MMSTNSENVWPDIGDIVFTVNGNGAVQEHVWLPYAADSGRFLMGNYFRTKEEAEAAVERQKIQNTMDKLAFQPDDGQEAYYIVFLPAFGDVEVLRSDAIRYGCPAFPSARLAHAIINCVTKEKLLRYWFGIKEAAA